MSSLDGPILDPFWSYAIWDATVAYVTFRFAQDHTRKTHLFLATVVYLIQARNGPNVVELDSAPIDPD